MRTKLLDGQTSADPRFRVTTGTVIGHYEVLRPVGAGGMAQVYLARDLELGRRVALKVIDARSMSAPGSEDFAREARTLAQFNHPNIITVFGAGIFVDAPYIAMEFVEGETLRARLESDVLAAREAQRLVLGVASGLEEAHRHDVIHGDLKPENVVISRDGRVRILDFGLARLFQTGTTDGTRLAPRDALRGELKNVERSSSNESSMRGTPDYMAPEQWRGEERTPAIDVWAFGVMLFEVFARRRPLQEASMLALCDRVASDEPLPSIRSFCDLPAPLAELIDRCVDKRADKRPSASECAAVLSRLVHGVVLERAEGDDAPFRGLSAFTEQHAAFFFGRDDDIAACIERLRDEPVLPIVGASGVGKSSFIQAGVIPRLREQGEWSVLRIRPGADPFRALASRLAMSKSAKRIRMALKQTGETPEDHAGGEVDPLVLARELYDNPKRLALMLRAEAKVQNARVLLLVDQLEEACTLVADHETRMRFFAAVCSAADDPLEPVRVVFTVRDDFLSRLAESAEARAALAHVMVLRAPGDDALVDILEKPPHAVGYRYDDPTLVADMIAAVKGELSALPLLQFCGSMLWDRRNTQARTLGRTAYQAIGGVQGALATHADSFMRELSETQAKLVRAVLLRLVTPEGTRRITAKKALLEALGPAVEPVLLSLTTSRLVSVREVFDEVHYELSHESLVQTWERLRTWLEEGREELVFLAEIEQASTLWDKRGRRVSEVWTGAPLKDALRRIERYQCKLTVVGEAFIASCVRAEQRRVFARRAVAIGGVAVLASIAIVSAITAVRFGEKTRIAVQERAAAQAEGARSAFLRGDYVSARALLRSSLEMQDSLLARSLWETLAADPIEWKRTIPTVLYDLALTPDRQTFVAAALDRTIYLIDRQTADVTPVRQHDDQVHGVAISRDGRLIASCDALGQVVIWDRASDTVRTIAAHTGLAWKVAFAPDGATLASVAWSGEIKLWRVADGALLHTFHEPEPTFRAVFTADGAGLVYGTGDGAIVWRDVASGAELKRLQKVHSAPVFSLDLASAPGLLVTGSEDKSIAVSDLREGKTLRRWSAHDAAVSAVRFAAGDTVIMSASYDSKIKAWSADGVLQRELTHHTSGIAGLVELGDGRWASAGFSDNTLAIVSTERAAGAEPDPGHTAPAQVVAFSHDGTQVYSAGDDKTVRVWDVATGRELRSFKSGGDTVSAIAISPDDTRVATGSFDTKVRVHDARSGEELFAISGHENAVRYLRFSPDATLLMSAAMDGTVGLASLAERRFVRRTPVGLTIDGAGGSDTLAVFSSRTSGHVVWQLGAPWSAGFPRSSLRVARGGGWTVAIAPDDQSYLLGSDRGELELHDAHGRLLRSTKVTTAAALLGKFLPDGKHVALGFTDGARWMRTDDPTRHVKLAGHLGEVTSVAVSSDGAHLATAGDDGTVRLFSGADARPIWRTRIVDHSRARALTHRGWLSLHDGVTTPATDAFASITTGVERSGLGCGIDGEGRAVVWRDGRVEAVAGWPTTEVAVDVRNHGSGCLWLSASSRAFHGQQQVTDVGDGVSTIAASDGALLLIGKESMRLVDPATGVTETVRLGEGVTAAAASASTLIVGFRDGGVSRIDRATKRVTALPLERQPAGSVRFLAFGAKQTVLAGYANGAVGMWTLDHGTLLQRKKLSANAVDVVFTQDRAHFVSALGSTVSLTLETLLSSRCAVLASVRARVPIVWKDGKAARAELADPCVEER